MRSVSHMVELAGWWPRDCSPLPGLPGARSYWPASTATRE